jgi:choline dehydrogenase-like flavoprotein
MGFVGMRWNSFKHVWYRAPFITRGVGVFIKVGDEPNGCIEANEAFEKPFEAIDHTRMDKAIGICRELLIKATCNPDTISVMKWAGGHPGGTIAMGLAVNKDFSTEIQGLYVCDGSVMPVSPGVPPALTICSMSRLLGKLMTGQVRVEDRLVDAAGPSGSKVRESKENRVKESKENRLSVS